MWSITQNHLGDIITACEDYSIWVFTWDPHRKATQAEINEFEKEILDSTNGGQELDLSGMPHIDEQSKIPGKHEGEIKVFRH